MSNTLFVLLDGAEDHPHPDLDGKKPIEVADMPFMKRVATHRLTTTGRGYTHLFLNEFFTGHPPEMARAAIEAMGLGLMDVMEPDRTAYRLSPATIGDGMVRWCYHAKQHEDRIVGSVNSHLDLLDGLDPHIVFFLGGRAIMTLRSDVVPELPAPPVDSAYVEPPGRLGDLVRAVASDLGGLTNYPWGCGKFGRQYNPVDGMEKMTAFSNTPTALGICASLGYETHLVMDFEDRFAAARKALDRGDVFLHIDEIDEYSHQRDPFKKKDVLEITDRLMSDYFSDVENIIFFVDHGTSCVTGEHILMDVPIWTTIDAGLPDGTMLQLKDVVSTLLKNKR